MAQIVLGPNRAYPNIPTVGDDITSHTAALNQIIEALNIHERRIRTSALDSFVRVRELEALGLIDLDGNVIVDNVDDTESTTHHHDSRYLRLDGSNDPVTGPVSFSSGLSATGLNASDPIFTGTIDVSGGSFVGLSSDDLSDVALLAMLDENEIVTGDWTFSGTLVIPEAAVTDHEAALTILESQITDGSILARVGSTETITAAWTFSTNPIFNNNLITDAYLRDSAALSVIGRSANSTGDPADMTAGTDGFVLRRSGTTLGFGTIATAGIANSAVTLAKMANLAQATIIGRASGAGTGVPTALTGAQVAAITNSSLDHGTLAGLSDDDHPQYAKLAGDTFTGTVSASSTVPRFRWIETDAPADETRWQALAESGNWSLRAYLDNESSNTVAMLVVRTGTTIDEIELNSTLLDFNGNVDISGSITAPSYNNSNWDTAYGWGDHASGGYAADSDVVHLTGDETVAGNKTFTGATRLQSAAGGTGAMLTSSTSYTSGTLNMPRLQWREADGTFHADFRAFTTTGANSYLELSVGTSFSQDFLFSDNGAFTAQGVITADSGDSDDWSAAYGWGNHASAGYAALAGATFTGGVTMNGATNAINGTTFNATPSGNINFSPGGAFQVTSGKLIKALDASNTYNVQMFHNGTDGYLQSSFGHLRFLTPYGTAGLFHGTSGDLYTYGHSVVSTNNKFMYGRSTGGPNYPVIGINGSDNIAIDPTGLGATFGGSTYTAGRARMAYGIDGGYAELGGDINFGGTIYSIGDAYKGGAAGNDSSSSGVYGLRWLRNSHDDGDATYINEGVYAFQNGVWYSGIGRNGIRTKGLLKVDGNATLSGSVYMGGDTTGHFQAVSGNYGSVEVDGADGSSGTYSGYSIGGRHVLMDNGSTTVGLYNDTNNEWMIQAADNGAVTLYYNGADALQTQSFTSTGVTSGARVVDHTDTYQDVGFNVLPTGTADAAATLAAEHCGHTFIKTTTTARTLTIPASSNVDFPVGGVCTILNVGSSNNITVSDDATATCYVLDGSAVTDIAGSATIAPGGVATLYRYSTTVYYLFGSGITP